MASQVRLRLLPSTRCLFDEPVQVRVGGLRSRQVVSLKATATDERGEVFTSWATYRADGGGAVDLDRDPSLGGSYVGVEPLGLLWSLKTPAPHRYFFKNNSLRPHLVQFSVHQEGGAVLAQATNHRCLMGHGVSRLPVREGGVRGVLFTPPGAGPFPAVLDLSTFVSEKRACLLANRGFVVLALAVFNDKPDNVKHLHLDSFEEAVRFLQRQPKVGSRGVGVISRSKGADIALSLAAFVAGVEAVVWINGSSANIGVPLFYKNRRVLSPLLMDFSKVVLTDTGARIIKYAIDDPRAEENQDAVVPVERADAQFLFAASEDDLNWDSKAYMEQLVERLRHHGKSNFQTVFYPRAGHLLEPPHGPFCPSATHGLLNYPVQWGGEPRLHVAAERHLWGKIQEFLKTHLSSDATTTQAKM